MATKQSSLFDQPDAYGASAPRFDGETFVPELDESRLNAQAKLVFAAMKSGEWRTLAEIAGITGAPEASVSARLRDFRKPEFGGHTVNRRRRGDEKRGLFEYQLRIAR